MFHVSTAHPSRVSSPLHNLSATLAAPVGLRGAFGDGYVSAGDRGWDSGPPRDRLGNRLGIRPCAATMFSFFFNGLGAVNGGVDGTRTRDPRRDRPVF
jgi:hypothetical protein